MKKVFSRLYNLIFKEPIQVNNALAARKNISIFDILQNKQMREIIVNKSAPKLLSQKDFSIKQNTSINKENPLLISPQKPLLLAPADAQQPLLLASYIKKDFVSGLLLLNEREQKLLMEVSALGGEFRYILSVLFLKVSYSFSSVPYHTLEENLKLGLENLFGNCSALNMSPQLKSILGDRIITILQHFTIIYWNNRNFHFEILNNIGKEYGIKCDTFVNTDIKMLSFIEIHLANTLKNHVLNCTQKKLDYHLINPEGFANSSTYFNEIDSMNRTGQKHADLLIADKPSNDLEEISKFYIDIKSYVTLSVYCCRFSIYHNDDKLLHQLINDLTVSLKKYITENKIAEKDPIYILYKNIIIIKKTKSLVFDTYKMIIEKLTPLIFDPNFQALKISIALDAGRDLHFDGFYNNIKYLHEKLGTMPDLMSPRVIELLEKMFPKSPIIDPISNVQTIKEFFDMFVPQPMRAQIEDHFETLVVKAITSS